jgi:hypothetical protein
MRILLVVLVAVFSVMAYGADSPEDVFWRSVSKVDLVEEYEIYIKQFPKGRYVIEAQQRLKKLHELEQLREESRRQKDRGEMALDAIRRKAEAGANARRSLANRSELGAYCASNLDCRENLICWRSRCDTSSESGNAVENGEPFVFQSEANERGGYCRNNADCTGGLICWKSTCVRPED